MNSPQIISLCFLLFSVLLLIAGIVFLPKNTPPMRKYLLISLILYISGTLLIAVIAFCQNGRSGPVYMALRGVCIRNLCRLFRNDCLHCKKICGRKYSFRKS